ncbi:MAG: hypothetical protein ACTHZ9_13430 [Leucobacter sp.]
MSSDYGFICKCSFDSTAVGFLFAPDKLLELGADFYCNCCGAVYDTQERLLLTATERLKTEYPALILGPGYPAGP